MSYLRPLSQPVLWALGLTFLGRSISSSVIPSLVHLQTLSWLLPVNTWVLICTNCKKASFKFTLPCLSPFPSSLISWWGCPKLPAFSSLLPISSYRRTHHHSTDTASPNPVSGFILISAGSSQSLSDFTSVGSDAAHHYCLLEWLLYASLAHTSYGTSQTSQLPQFLEPVLPRWLRGCPTG